ncbi:MAG: hypothetical protein LCI00_24710 [Chloroflexi bacterium]|nr:hypothetical protein [Chloroflexota bacterium]MCC6895812.1 hypothetical protein [Anaerolineae bacterium]
MLLDTLDQNPIVETWPPELQAHYQAFTEQLTLGVPLKIKVGKGGLSYYLPHNGQSLFICHFNAKPQGKRDDLGFADFRYDRLQKIIDIDETIAAMQAFDTHEIIVKRHKLWCCVEFLLERECEVAALFRQHIVAKLI